jgi:diguanylate cyclase (GGDEF)-like protein/PAS domain S-box-containing protein
MTHVLRLALPITGARAAFICMISEEGIHVVAGVGVDLSLAAEALAYAACCEGTHDVPQGLQDRLHTRALTTVTVSGAQGRQLGCLTVLHAKKPTRRRVLEPLRDLACLLSSALEQEHEHLALELLEARGKLAHLLSVTPTVIYTLQRGEEDRLTFVSENVRSVLGHDTESFLEDAGFWKAHVHPEDYPGVLKVFDACEVYGAAHCEYRFRNRDGSYRWIQDAVTFEQSGHQGARTLMGSWLDVTQRKETEQALRLAHTELEQRENERALALAQVTERLQFDAFHDALTRLPNRALFMNRLEQAIKRYERSTGAMFAVLYLDSDRFKVINDGLGHSVGDGLLLGISERLASVVRPSDTVACLGGDEFALILEDISSLEDAVAVAERILNRLTQPFDIEEQEIRISASIGVVASRLDHECPDDILRDADIAMYRAKMLGRAQFVVFEPEMRSRVARTLALESELRSAVERRELMVYYQPIVSVGDGAVIGVEALVRWLHPERGFVSPAEFIPIAEESGLIVDIDRWVLYRACRQLKLWQEAWPEASDLTLNVNLSGRQFLRKDLVSNLSSLLLRTRMDPRQLRLELTESVLLNSTSQVRESLTALKGLGVQLHLDDFGMGYSSLSYLHRYPIDAIKIDRSFINQMMQNSDSAELVRTIVSMAHNLRLKVVAEGVEMTEQLAVLRSLGCEFTQGFLFSKPLPPEELVKYLKTDRIFHAS